MADPMACSTSSSLTMTGSTVMGLTAQTDEDVIYSVFPLDISTAPRTMGMTTGGLPQTTILDYVEKELIDRLKMPQRFLVYAFSLPHQLSQEQIIDLLEQWGGWDILHSLANYRSVVKMLFGILKDTLTRGFIGSTYVVANEIFENLSQDAEVLRHQLVSIFRDSGTYKSFLACRGDLAQQLLDLLQDLLDLFPESPDRPRLSKALLRLSRASGLHPTCFPLTHLQEVGKQVAAGAFSDICKGLVHGQSVSIKIMRLFRDAPVRTALKEFGREAVIWRQLSHPNVLPFFGLYSFSDGRLCLVSPWMSNGHILEFLQNPPPDTDRVSLMLDVAMGLKYLHGKHVVHGDLKGVCCVLNAPVLSETERALQLNILVTPSRRACVADFGLSSIVDAMSLRFTHSTPSAKGGTARYQAPELLLGQMQNHYGSDIYAFACVCYEILTGKPPFYGLMNDMAVALNVTRGYRPSRPEFMPLNSLWKLLQDCWEQEPVKRPKTAEIIQRLVSSPIGAKKGQCGTDWDETFSSKFRRSLQEWPLLPSVTAIERRIFGDAVVEGEPSWFLAEVPGIDEHSADCIPGQNLSNQDYQSGSSTFPLLPSSIGYLSSLPDNRWQPSGIISPTSRGEVSVRNGLQSTWIPISCLSANHYVPIHSDDRPPQMCRVFVSTDDLQVHHAAPQNLPPLPRLGTSGLEVHRSPTPNNFSSLCENFLKMRAEAPADPPTDGPDSDFQAYLTSPNVGLYVDGYHPLFGTPDLDWSPFTSPLETPYDTFAPTPDDSPFSDFLSTPVLPAASDAVVLVDDGGHDNHLSLFGGPTFDLPAISPRSLPHHQNRRYQSAMPDDIDDSSSSLFPRFHTKPSSSSAMAASKPGQKPDSELERQHGLARPNWKRSIEDTLDYSTFKNAKKRRRMDPGISSVFDNL
ncbi:kinase-like domain-containing protein [Mycena capillaripes]|nr:kinase-like domain-containing protein [Mycena capillaripes]